MKKIFLLLAMAVSAQNSMAQADSGSTAPPPPTQAIPTPTPTTITTTTVTTTPVAPTPPPTPPPTPHPPPAATQATTYTAPPAYTPAPAKPHIDVRRLRLGAYIAPTLSWMHPTASKDDAGEYNVKSNGSKIGFMYGLMVDYNFAPNYAIVTGLQINTTGGKMLAERISQTPANSTVKKADFDYSLTYLQLPLAVKLRTDDISGFRFFAQLGITAGINVGKKGTYTVNYSDANGKDTVATGSKIKLTGDLGLIAPVFFEMNIGIGTEYPFSNKLTGYFGLFFNNGFAPDATKPDLFDAAKLGYQGSFKDASTRLNNFALRLGLFF